MNKGKNPKKPPKSPSRDERNWFEDILNRLYGIADLEPKFHNTLDSVEKDLDRIDSDGNVKTRWNAYLNFIPDSSPQEVKTKLEAARLMKAKLDGSHWGAGGEDLYSMTIPELKEYAKEMKWEGPYPRRKADLIAAIEKRLEGDDGEGEEE